MKSTTSETGTQTGRWEFNLDGFIVSVRAHAAASERAGITSAHLKHWDKGGHPGIGGLLKWCNASAADPRMFFRWVDSGEREQ